MPSPVPESAPYIPSCGSLSTRLSRFADAADAEDRTESGRLWIVLGDIHGCIRRVRDIPELEQAVGVIITGDLTTLGGVAAARTVIEAFQAVNPVILAQIGNMDRAEVNDWLEERGITQVSMNLVDYEKNSLYRVLETIRMEAKRWGVGVVETEVYGMIPVNAILESAAYYLQIAGFDPEQVLELRLLELMGKDAE